MSIHHKNIWIDIIGWCLLAVVLLLVIPMLYPVRLPLVYHIYHMILFGALFGVYYLNTRIIIPKFIKKGINFYYILLFLLLSGLVIGIMFFIETKLNVRSLVYNSMHPNTEYKPEENKSYINYYLFFLMSIVFSVGYMNHLFSKWNLEKQKNNKLEERKAKAELDSLKAQIHPHFFFNTLNTIYALTYTNIEKSQEAILSLSSMMRYVMNEENRHFVTLREETSFIHNYLELMKHRLPDTIKTQFNLTQEHPNATIAPMILLNFVENCFKHGLSTESECFIKITTDFEGDYLVFKTENDWFRSRQNNNSTGIGIENTRKRLDIIYPKAYSLEHSIIDNRYYCILKIKLL